MTHQVTDESRKLVESASGMGLRHTQIATLIGVTEKTLRKRYRKELDEGIAKAHYNVAKTTYDKAVAGNPTMLIWYEKTRMGLRETVQIATPPGESLAVKGGPELLETYYARLEAAKAGAGADPGAAAHLGPDRRQGEGRESDPDAGDERPLLPPR